MKQEQNKKISKRTLFPSHSIIEDIFSITQAVIIFSVGIIFFKSSNLIAGGTSGLSLIFDQLTNYSFGFWLFVINIPFYVLGFIRFGLKFVTYTLISVISVSFLVDSADKMLTINIAHPLVSSILGGLFAGVGLLIMFRHRASMGGLNILALYIQDYFGLSAGKFQLGFDVILLTICYFLFNIDVVIYSSIALLIVNWVLIVNHKPGRYSPS